MRTIETYLPICIVGSELLIEQHQRKHNDRDYFDPGTAAWGRRLCLSALEQRLLAQAGCTEPRAELVYGQLSEYVHAEATPDI